MQGMYRLLTEYHMDTRPGGRGFEASRAESVGLEKGSGAVRAVAGTRGLKFRFENLSIRTVSLIFIPTLRKDTP